MTLGQNLGLLCYDNINVVLEGLFCGVEKLIILLRNNTAVLFLSMDETVAELRYYCRPKKSRL
jgi:hypothetical protein